MTIVPTRFLRNGFKAVSAFLTSLLAPFRMFSKACQFFQTYQAAWVRLNYGLGDAVIDLQF